MPSHWKVGCRGDRWSWLQPDRSIRQRDARRTWREQKPWTIQALQKARADLPSFVARGPAALEEAAEASLDDDDDDDSDGGAKRQRTDGMVSQREMAR